MSLAGTAGASPPRSLCLLLALLVAGCEPAEAPRPAASNPPAAPSTAPAGKGAVTGAVTVPPEHLDPVRPVAKGFETWCGAGPLDPRIYEPDRESRGLPGVFVWVDGPAADFAPPAVPVLDQARCVFDPPMLVVAPGDLVIRNSDSMAHNTTIEGKVNEAVNVNLPPGRSTTARLAFAEAMKVRCSVHPWMVSSLVVTRTSAHAVTDAKGRFRIEGAAAGRRKLRAWHPLGPELEVEVEVKADGVVDVPLAWVPRPNFRAPFGR